MDTPAFYEDLPEFLLSPLVSPVFSYLRSWQWVFVLRIASSSVMNLNPESRSMTIFEWIGVGYAVVMIFDWFTAFLWPSYFLRFRTGRNIRFSEDSLLAWRFHKPICLFSSCVNLIVLLRGPLLSLDLGQSEPGQLFVGQHRLGSVAGVVVIAALFMMSSFVEVQMYTVLLRTLGVYLADKADRYECRLRESRAASAFAILKTKIPRYSYKPLPSPRHFRLLRLSQLDDNSSVRSELLTFELDSAPQYEAISYRWGADHDALNLILRVGEAQFQSLPLRPPLVRILTRLFPEKHERYLWIDAICIQQEGPGKDADKATQIPLMGEIYGKAEQVIVCLDTPSLPASLAITLLELLKSLPKLWNLTSRSTVLGSFTPAWHANILGRYKSKLDSIMPLFRDEYWHRLWVVQEMALARKLVVLASNQFLEWEVFAGVVETLFTFESQAGPSLALQFMHRRMREASQNITLYDNGASAAIPRIKEFRKRVHGGLEGSAGIWDIVFQFRECKVTFAHDRVYGFLGLLSALGVDLSGSIFQTPQYLPQLSYADLLTAVAEFTVTSGALPPLHFSGRYQAFRASHLPSWVPDPGSLGGNDVFLSALESRAGHSSSLLMRYPTIAVGGKLHIAAVTLGRVSAVKEYVWDSVAWGENPLAKGTKDDLMGETNEKYEATVRALEYHYLLHLSGMRSFVASRRNAGAITEGTLLETLGAEVNHQEAAADEFRGDRTRAIGVLLDFAENTISQYSRSSDTSNFDFQSLLNSISQFAIDHGDTDLWKRVSKDLRSLSRWRYLSCFTTAVVGGRLALVPIGTQLGDVLTVMAGVNTPSMLRVFGPDGNTYELVGPAYVDGLMRGEAVEMDGWDRIVLA